VWLFNPPVVDLFDPRVVGWEIERSKFETARDTAEQLSWDD